MGHGSMCIYLFHDGDGHKADQVKSSAVFSACAKIIDCDSYIFETNYIFPVYIWPDNTGFQWYKEQTTAFWRLSSISKAYCVKTISDIFSWCINPSRKNILYLHLVLKCILSVSYCALNIRVSSGGFNTPRRLWRIVHNTWTKSWCYQSALRGTCSEK